MQKKPQYFDAVLFAHRVMKACGLENVNAKTREVLEENIIRRLSERIMATVIDSFGEREFLLLEKMMEDHQELDEIDAIMVISSEVPKLDERLEKGINDLFEEMVYDAEDIQQAMDNRQLVQDNA